MLRYLSILFLLTLPALATPIHSQSAAGITAGTSAALTLTLSGTVIGEKLFFAYGLTSSSVTATVTDSCGDTFTFPTTSGGAAGSNPWVTASRTAAGGYTTLACGGTISVIITPSGTVSIAAAISTIDNTSTVEFATLDNSATGTSVTTTAADLIWSWGADLGVNGSALSNGSGYTQHTGSTQCPSFPCGDESKTQNSSGSVNASWTYSGGLFFTFAIMVKPIPTSYVSFTPSTMYFGSEIINATTLGQAVTITNVGSATLNISSIALTTGTQFTKSSTTCGSTLAAAASCTATVTFTPTSSGGKTDSLIITSDSPTSPDTVSVSGRGSILDPSRSIDWSLAGAGTIPTRTTICTNTACAALTSAGTSATLTQINAAISTCPSGQTILLASGTYGPYTNEIIFDNVSNCTLRGAGPKSTIIKFSTCGNGNGLGACIYAQNTNPDYSGAPDNVATWTAGYSQGTNSLTLTTFSTGSINNLAIGSLLILDQLDDSFDPAPTYPYVCQTTGSGNCTTEGSSGANGGRAGRAQNQQVTVTSISGSGPWTIGITPALYDSNWRSGQTPNVWFSSHIPVTGVGLENFTVDTTSSAATGSIFMFDNASYSWIKNVRSINTSGMHKHVWLYQSSHITIRDSYFFGSAGASESYSIDSSFSSSDNLTINNICQHVATCTITEGDVGSVFAYNYPIDNFYTAGGGSPDFQQLDCSHHGAYDHLTLWEGNQGSGCGFDNTHGYSFANSLFRNYYTGLDTAGGGTKTAQTIPVQYYQGNRFGNVIGNVLGTSGYHSIYQSNPASSTTCGSLANGNVSIYDLGWSQTEGTRYATLGTCGSGLGGSFNLPNDTSVVSNIMRWGNYDVENGTNQFVSGEVPSGLSAFANAIPGNQTLPSSFIFDAQPSWWSTPYTTPPFPANGPDVVTGNISNVGGRANNIPSAQCFQHMQADTSYGTTASLSTCTESGTTVTCTATTTLNAAFAVGYLVNVSGNGVSGYNALGGYPITAKTSTTFSYTDATTGLSSGSGGTARVNPVFVYDAGVCYGTPPSGGFKLGLNTKLGSNSVMK